MKEKKIVITGATGFVGQFLGRELQDRSFSVVGLSRNLPSNSTAASPFEIVAVGNLEDCPKETLIKYLAGATTVIHLAGRAHVMNEKETNPAIAYQRANVNATSNLLKACQEAKVGKFIFASTIKVNGEESTSTYNELSQPKPQDPYGESKFMAEKIIQDWSNTSGIEAVILRLPLLYGPGVKGNMASLLKVLQIGLPLPVGALKYNRRSLLSLSNLVSIIETLINTPRPNSERNLYLISDRSDLSTAGLVTLIAKQMKISWATLPFPPKLLQLCLKLIKKDSLYSRLAGSLAVDSSAFAADYNWSPTHTPEQGVQVMLAEMPWEICPLWKRLFDFLTVLIVGIFLLPVIGIVALAVKITSPGPIFHWSKRIGTNNRLFLMPKFRTMKVDTPQVATHLLTNANDYLTSVGSVLRATSLDELPQLWSVLKGDMSLVGPRPALYNQDDLIELRTRYEVHRLRPGITGHAQINGRDSISIPQKVALDADYLASQSFTRDLQILFKTIYNVASKTDISH